LREINVTPEAGVPLDRAFALAHGSAQFDPLNPEWQPPASFFQLKRDERLAMLQTSYDAASGVLTVLRDGRRVARGNLDQTAGRMVLEQFFDAWLKPAGRGRPKLLRAAGHGFSDAPEPLVSLIGNASIKDLERVVGRPVDPLRFRANLYLDGLPAWAEFAWVGRRVRIGGATLVIVERIVRCAATNVDPATGARDLNLPGALQRAYGHTELGVYGRVVAAGRIAPGDAVEL